MKPAKISRGLGIIRRAQASGSVTGALAGWGGSHVSTTDVPCPGAEMMPGVTVVRDGDFVGVTAPDPQVAEKALAALKPTWEPTSAEASSTDALPFFTVFTAFSRATGFTFGSTSGANLTDPVKAPFVAA